MGGRGPDKLGRHPDRALRSRPRGCLRLCLHGFLGLRGCFSFCPSLGFGLRGDFPRHSNRLGPRSCHTRCSYRCGRLRSPQCRRPRERRRLRARGNDRSDRLNGRG
jgi:hypothetical protein